MPSKSKGNDEGGRDIPPGSSKYANPQHNAHVKSLTGDGIYVLNLVGKDDSYNFSVDGRHPNHIQKQAPYSLSNVRHQPIEMRGLLDNRQRRGILEP
jgi:hypothetical protein